MELLAPDRDKGASVQAGGKGESAVGGWAVGGVEIWAAGAGAGAP